MRIFIFANDYSAYKMLGFGCAIMLNKSSISVNITVGYQQIGIGFQWRAEV